jgi:hypothetical protein
VDKLVNADKVVVTFGDWRWEVPYERICHAGDEKEALSEVMITLCGADSPFSDVAVPLVPARAKDICLYAEACANEGAPTEIGFDGTLEEFLEEYMLEAWESE